MTLPLWPDHEAFGADTPDLVAAVAPWGDDSRQKFLQCGGVVRDAGSLQIIRFEARQGTFLQELFAGESQGDLIHEVEIPKNRQDQLYGEMRK